ncbi:MAG: hypothetical protein GY755_02640 [Chloroflexi bacterium]|nr:hypothetical protein [Chloroflexota bacterium]
MAQGTYYPDEGTGQSNDNRTSAFTLKNVVAIYGGFDGSEPLRTDRDWENNTTTLSGDIDQVSGDSGNAYHVLIGSSTDGTAILDGFTITAGTAEGTGPSDTNGLGGGMYSNNGSPTLTNLVFSNNSAKNYHGGGLYATGSTPAITNVTFISNTAAIGGGGAFIHLSSVSTIKNITFSNNTAGYEGGGLHLFFSNLILENMTFSGNTSSGGTGHDSSFGHHGGGLYNGLGSSPQLTNITFSGNSAEEEGGGIFNEFGNPTLNNIILWGNTAPVGAEMDNFFATPVITNSVIKGSNGSGGSWDTNLGTDNGSNLDADPQLTPLADNGGIIQTHGLLPGSSAIDKGASCPATDQRGISRPQGAGCDIGAYEFGGFSVSSTSPTSGATLVSLDTIEVTFSEDALHDSSTKAADYTDNYILVEAGANGSFNTLSCAGGVISDDVEQNIIDAAYTNNGGAGPFTATLTLENPLEDGDYRLFICGTTSIWSVTGMELNDGLVDNTVSFTIGLVATASSLPKTGFRHGRVTRLPKQPTAKAYTDTAMMLEIPKLNVSMPIVGVPQSADGWDVTWLGNSAGYLAGSAFPTWAGNTVITGHV